MFTLNVYYNPTKIKVCFVFYYCTIKNRPEHDTLKAKIAYLTHCDLPVVQRIFHACMTNFTHTKKDKQESHEFYSTRILLAFH